jgi:hypothetical protein
MESKLVTTRVDSALLNEALHLRRRARKLTDSLTIAEELKMLRNRFENPGTLIRIGMLFLILFNVWNWMSRYPVAHVSPDLMDLISGVLLGVSIGCVLLGIRRNVRDRRTHASNGPA